LDAYRRERKKVTTWQKKLESNQNWNAAFTNVEENSKKKVGCHKRGGKLLLVGGRWLNKLLRPPCLVDTTLADGKTVLHVPK
jgi:hypothetical protein